MSDPLYIFTVMSMSEQIREALQKNRPVIILSSTGLVRVNSDSALVIKQKKEGGK